MQSPALTEKQYRQKLDAIEKCGANRGPHDYIPMAWMRTETSEHVTHLLCRTCFVRVNVQTLFEHYHEVKL